MALILLQETRRSRRWSSSPGTSRSLRQVRNHSTHILVIIKTSVTNTCKNIRFNLFSICDKLERVDLIW